jgi:release factor glutamine methyltransferase
MQKIIGRLASTFYKPLLTKYLSPKRNYRYEDIRLRISPEVFHPRFFFSTRLLINYIKGLEVDNKTFLELGAGSGLISFYAAKRNAKVTATDINPVAIEYLHINSLQNDVAIQIILSDMFKNIPQQDFDLVITNPPYYKRNAITFRDYAWYCGENGEYFQSLFKSLGDYMHNTSIVLMILSQNCDFGMIRSIAEKNQFRLDCTYKRKNIMEENYIYKIERSWVVNPDYSS